MLARLVPDKLIEALRVGCEAAKKVIKPLIIYLVEVIVNVVHQGKMDFLLMHRIETLSQSDTVVNTLTR